MQPQNGINTYSQGDLQRMIRQVSDLYTQTAEATARELDDASALSEAGGENFKVSTHSFSQRVAMSSHLSGLAQASLPNKQAKLSGCREKLLQCLQQTCFMMS